MRRMKWANNFHINTGHRRPGKEENMDMNVGFWQEKHEDFGHVGSNTMDKEYRFFKGSKCFDRNITFPLFCVPVEEHYWLIRFCIFFQITGWRDPLVDHVLPTFVFPDEETHLVDHIVYPFCVTKLDIPYW
jgi:hypothetical protein